MKFLNAFFAAVGVLALAVVAIALMVPHVRADRANNPYPLTARITHTEYQRHIFSRRVTGSGTGYIDGNGQTVPVAFNYECGSYLRTGTFAARRVPGGIAVLGTKQDGTRVECRLDANY